MDSSSAALTAPTPDLPILCFRLRACIFSELLRTPFLSTLRMGLRGLTGTETPLQAQRTRRTTRGHVQGRGLGGGGVRGGVRGLRFPRATESARRARGAGSGNYAEMRRGVEGRAQDWGGGAEVRPGPSGHGVGVGRRI